MAEPLTINFSQPMALFPLPNCVLLPHTTIPLHIFESRYKQMVKDTLDAQGLIAMALFEGNDWKHDDDNTPSLRSHVCVGYIIRHHQFDDGRYNMLLQGVCRARIVEELPNDPYRKAILEPTEPHPLQDIDLDHQRKTIERLLSDPLLKQLASINAIHNWFSAQIPTIALIDLSIMAASANIEQRYQMLAESDARSRARWLEHNLQDMRRALDIAQRFTPPEHPDHIHVN